MKCIRIIFSILIWVAGTITAIAQTVFTTNVSANKIARNELLEINYEIQNGNLENFIQPSFPGWQLVGGPNLSSGTYITNGQKTTSISYQYVLKPLSKGTFTLPGAKAVVDGKQISSNSVTVIVENKDAANPRGSQQSQSLFPFLNDEPAPQQEDPADNYDGYVLREGENANDKTKANLFILVNVDKKTCYEGEPILATYQLYTRVNLNAHITKRPSFTGFSSIDLPDNNNGEYQLGSYKGKQYRIYTIRKVQLYPLLAGNQVLQPAELDATVQYKRVPSPGNMSQYDPYSPDNIVNLNYTVKGEPVTITVLPLPAETRPANFTGAVGQFEIKTSLTKPEIARKEAGKVRVEITGKGNWSMVQAPKIAWPKGVEVYEPTVTESLDSQAIPVAGKKVYEYSFSSNQPGKITIPAISLAFFNPVNKQYKEVSAAPLTLTILNKVLPESTSNIEEDYSLGDPTQIFTDIVKIVFPVAALGLLIWLVTKNSRKRRQQHQEMLWQRHFQHNNELERKLAEAKEQEIATAAPAAPPKPFDASRYQPVILMENPMPPPPIFTMADSAPEENMPPTETTGKEPIPVLAKDYFTALKKELLYLVEWHWQIMDTNALSIKLKLLAKGLLPDDAESVAMLLEACDKHIYSPFGEMIDKTEWDEITAEIQSVLKKPKR